MKKKVDMFDWWVSTVGLTLFPIIASFLISIVHNGQIVWDVLCGNGELVLCGFLIVVPSILNIYRTRSDSITQRGQFVLLLFTAFLILVTYVAIRMTAGICKVTLWLSSVFAVIASVVVARHSELYMGREKQ